MFPIPEQQLRADLLFDAVLQFLFTFVSVAFVIKLQTEAQRWQNDGTGGRKKEERRQRWLGGWMEKKEYSHIEKERKMWKEDEYKRLSLLLEPVMGMI